VETPLATGIFISIPPPIAQQPLVDQGPLIIQVSRSRSVTQNQTPLDDLSAPRRDLYLTTHKTHKWQTSMSPTGFEPAIPPSERPQTHALDRADTGTGCMSFNCLILWYMLVLTYKICETINISYATVHILLTDHSLVDEFYAGSWITSYVTAWLWADWTWGLLWNLEYATYILQILNRTELVTN